MNLEQTLKQERKAWRFTSGSRSRLVGWSVPREGVGATNPFPWKLIPSLRNPENISQRASEIENFEREWNFRASHPPRPYFFCGNSTHRSPIFCGEFETSRLNISSEIEFFWSLGPLGNPCFFGWVFLAFPQKKKGKKISQFHCEWMFSSGRAIEFAAPIFSLNWKCKGFAFSALAIGLGFQFAIGFVVNSDRSRFSSNRQTWSTKAQARANPLSNTACDTISWLFLSSAEAYSRAYPRRSPHPRCGKNWVDFPVLPFFDFLFYQGKTLKLIKDFCPLPNPLKAWKKQRKNTNNQEKSLLKINQGIQKNQGMEGQGLFLGVFVSLVFLLPRNSLVFLSVFCLLSGLWRA